jgi:RNA polymerase sigma-54 factor
MLELIEGIEEDENQTTDADANTESASQAADSPDNKTLDNPDEEYWQSEIPKDLEVDSSWDDVYTNSPPPSQNFEADDFDYESRNSAEETLQDHLLWQLNLTPMSESDEAIAIAIIDAIDPNGWLTVNLESILIVREYIELLGHRDYALLMRKTKLKEAELAETIAVIEDLDPRPGANIAPESTDYVVPDVIVTKHANSGKWKVELNPETAPKIRINSSYASLVKRADTSSDNNFLRDNLQEARWFLKSLQSRNETLMKVATRIVEHQKGFLEYGDEAMKPLVLHDIAEAVSMHESTISRVTTQKYMYTPRGIFELKYFFSSHVSTKGGGECSSTAIRAIIKKLIAAENKRKPLSDSKITELLEDKGINVARRTIAKYRESLSIPPSNERKRLSD